MPMNVAHLRCRMPHAGESGLPAKAASSAGCIPGDKCSYFLRENPKCTKHLGFQKRKGVKHKKQSSNLVHLMEMVGESADDHDEEAMLEAALGMVANHAFAAFGHRS
jgi:hypothetical protein